MPSKRSDERNVRRNRFHRTCFFARTSGCASETYKCSKSCLIRCCSLCTLFFSLRTHVLCFLCIRALFLLCVFLVLSSVNCANVQPRLHSFHLALRSLAKILAKRLESLSLVSVAQWGDPSVNFMTAESLLDVTFYGNRAR